MHRLGVPSRLQTVGAKLAAAIASDPETPVTVDLEQQTIARGNRSFAFTVDPVSRNQLLNGWDDVDMTESHRDRISAFKAAHPGLPVATTEPVADYLLEAAGTVKAQ